MRTLQRRTKYAVDRVAAFLLLVLLSPVMLLVALLIRADDGGAVFFRQDRVGRDGGTFRMWKFRTMVEDADRYLDAGGRVAAQGRITRVGTILRRWSLDELPQLFNILVGDMSLVGPRPVLPAHLPRYSRRQHGRFLMKPGVTGLAQVSGRNTLKWSQRLELDVQYVERYSLWLDASILLRTVRVFLTGSGLVLDRNPEDVDDLPVIEPTGPGTGAS